jgi:hypothetical protein
MSISVVMPKINNVPFHNRGLTLIVGDPALDNVLIYQNASIELVTEFAHPKVRLNRGVRNIGATRARHSATLQAPQPFLSNVDANDFVAGCTLSHCPTAVIADDLDTCGADVVAVSVDGPDGRPFAARPPRMSGAAALLWTSVIGN